MVSTTVRWMLVLSVLVVVSTIPWTEGSSRVDLINKLSDMVENEQMTTTKPYGGLGDHAQLEGVYKSNIQLNFRGKCEMSLLRKFSKFPSIQSFITGYVAVLLYDAYIFGNAPRPSIKSVERVATVYGEFTYKNTDYNNSFVTFFPQEYDEETDFWVQRPGDIIVIFKLLKDLKISTETIAHLLLGDNLPPDLIGLFDPEETIRRDRLPPDMDSTGIHLSFGAYMYHLRHEFPNAWDTWSANNPNVTSVFDAAKKYAYRPFSDDPDASFIDPRTYYILRDLIEDAKKEERDLVLLTTWAQSIQELRVDTLKDVSMPWSTNNVDVAVVANLFAGMISSVTFGMIDPQVINDDEDFIALIDSCAEVVSYLAGNNFADRVDIAVIYYPHVIQNYWFIARNLMLMESGRANGALPVPALERYHQKLADAMRKKSTPNILKMRNFAGDGQIYFEEFLGNADVSYYDRPIKRHEDRIFTTAMAANSLLYIWTVHDSVNGLRWIEGTPMAVKQTIFGCAKWLEANTLTGEFEPYSVFFCRDFNMDALPFWYPANRFEYINGTKIDDFTYIPSELASIGVQGYVEPEEYEEMMKVVQFGMPRPEFIDFNHSSGSMLYFSSEAYTYASVMMALSMTERLQERESR